jgi:stress response protein YsnF/sporulation protein YlmC with PRC-barrel domain
MITHTEVRDLIGAELLDSSGIKVGRIGQIYLDESTGELEWATVNTGRFGVNETFVPLAQADRAGRAVRVPYEKATIKDAPNMFACGAHLDESKERELYIYYGLDYAGQRSDSGIPSGQATSIQPGRGPQAKRGSAGRDTSARDTDDAMTRSEEQVHGGTEKVTVARARLRKWVETEDVHAKAPVAKEQARPVTERITDANRVSALDGPAIAEDEHEVTLTEERPVVAKESVPVARVRLTKETVQDVDRVAEQIRKERIQAEGDVDLA